MTWFNKGVLALALLGSAVFLPTRTFAVEPDVDSAAGPELPAPRYSHPDFQYDDQAGAPRERDIEGTDAGDAPVVVAPNRDTDEPHVVIVPE